ncbi:myelin basic protein-like isoform X1 [Acanthochromis polyacanthus]|uniref:myelin basic protein-like isoform X1 n=1 Tax=Acanthochromis polyacanthus TaxID=80966 RepID=UPI0022349819|nr:myelin basic protein-like isoform X1 [Acanthochromis polyacanthus]
MASASSSAQAAFGLGRRKKNPGLLDQIGKFFGGDKKRKSKGSFRGALSPAPQKASATSPRKRGAENAVVHFFRTIVSPAPPKSRWPAEVRLPSASFGNIISVLMHVCEAAQEVVVAKRGGKEILLRNCIKITVKEEISKMGGDYRWV